MIKLTYISPPASTVLEFMAVDLIERERELFCQETRSILSFNWSHKFPSKIGLIKACILFFDVN